MATTAPPVAATATAPSVAELCLAARDASRALAALPTGTKDAALHAIADALEARTAEILEANARDMEAGRANGLDAALLDRLALDEGRVQGMAEGVRAIAALPDPVGELIDGQRLPNGLDVAKLRVPLGVVAVVYEARPNVTIDAAALCLKSGNAIVLRGLGRDAREHRVGVRGRRRPAQHARVPRLQAQGRSVDRHVRPRLVDDGHHSQRDPHLAHLEPVLQAPAADHLADGIGQRGDLTRAVGDPADAVRVEPEPVEQRLAQPRLGARLHVTRVGLEDLRRALLERVRDCLQRGIARAAVCRREPARRPLGGRALLGD